jgi:hypothetical protein
MAYSCAAQRDSLCQHDTSHGTGQLSVLLKATRGSIPGGVRDISPLQEKAIAAVGSTQPPVPRVPGTLTGGVRLPQRDAHH